jgi:hypothetical protein
MIRMFVGFILSLVLPPTYTGKKYLIQALTLHDVAMPDELIEQIVQKCIPDAKEKAKLARLAGTHELANWRANVVRELDSVVTAIVCSRNGEPLDVYLHAKAVNDLLVATGYALPPLKARLGMRVCCEDGHLNGFFGQDVQAHRDITQSALHLCAEPDPDDGSRYLCSRCGAPVAICVKDRDKWAVCIEGNWVT